MKEILKDWRISFRNFSNVWRMPHTQLKSCNSMFIVEMQGWGGVGGGFPELGGCLFQPQGGGGEWVYGFWLEAPLPPSYFQTIKLLLFLFPYYVLETTKGTGTAGEWKWIEKKEQWYHNGSISISSEMFHVCVLCLNHDGWWMGL